MLAWDLHPLDFFAGHHDLLISSASFHTPLTHPHLSSFPSVRKLRIRQTKLQSSIWKREGKQNGMFLHHHFPEQAFVRVYYGQGMGDQKKLMEFWPAMKWREKQCSSHCGKKPAYKQPENVHHSTAWWRSNGSHTC